MSAAQQNSHQHHSYLRVEENPFDDYLETQIDEYGGEEDDLRDEHVQDVERRLEVSKVKK